MGISVFALFNGKLQCLVAVLATEIANNFNVVAEPPSSRRLAYKMLAERKLPAPIAGG
jgi:hypothetical protein